MNSCVQSLEALPFKAAGANTNKQGHAYSFCHCGQLKLCIDCIDLVVIVALAVLCSMSDNGRPLKRARLLEIDSSSPASSNHVFERHDEFWLPDGNIILVANKTTGFCIYRGLVSSQSTVFEDMFTASTSNSEELFEGCPVIHLLDSPQDLAHLLCVLLPKSRRLYVYPSYQLPHFYDTAVNIALP